MAALARGVFDELSALVGEIEPDAATREASIAQMKSSLEVVLGECKAIDGEFRDGLAQVATRAFVTEHNGFAYLERRYNLRVAATIRAQHGVEPAPRDIEAAEQAAREQGVLAIFVEPQYAQAGARRIAEITGLRLLMLDALGDGDYPAMMRANLVALREGLGAAGPAGEGR